MRDLEAEGGLRAGAGRREKDVHGTLETPRFPVWALPEESLRAVTW